MDRAERIRFLNTFLLEEMPRYRAEALRFPGDPVSQRRLLRSLMNLRPPMALPESFLRAQDALLTAEREEKGVVDPQTLPVTEAEPRIALWQGDITRLAAGAIVNAANPGMTGCYVPCHGCIDNAIHSAAGLELREECARLMREQGHEEPAGRAKLTKGYNLPARYVLHTVGPVITGPVTERDRAELSACYRSCLELAAEKGLESLAFCCISTGEYHFPKPEAARIAVGTVRDFLRRDRTLQKVIFNVHSRENYEIYRRLLEPGAGPVPGGR